MSLQELSSKVKRKKKKLLGRGNGSGKGTFSGRGVKGQKARSGGNIRPGFEGGQTPYMRKLPKLKGFKNINHVDYQVVNVGDLNLFDNNATITVEDLYAKNLIGKKNKPVKLLGGKSDLEKTVTVSIHKASASAIKKVEEKNGKVQLLEK